MRNENNYPVVKNARSKRVLRLVGGAALAAAVAFGGGSLLNSNTSVTYAQTAPAATPNAGGTTVAPSTGQDNQAQFGQKGMRGGKGQNMNGSRPGDSNHSGGTISAVSSDSLTITRPDNSTQKVVLSSTTTYTDLNKTIALSDIKSGMKVDVDGTLNSDGTFQATSVRIEHDRMGGTVTAINGNSITVTLDGKGQRGGDKIGRGPNNNSGTSSSTVTPNTTTTTTATTKTIVVDSSTVYMAAGQSSQLSNITVGSQIMAEGTLSTDGNSLTALQVMIQMPRYHGQVTVVDGSTITIQDRDGSHTIVVDSNTKYMNGTATAALSDVKAGVNIEAEGTVDSAGKMTASLVQLGQGQQGPGHGGRGH